MKKSKLIALTLTFIFILTACEDGGSGYLFDYSRQIAGQNFYNTEGSLFHKNVYSTSTKSAYNKIHYLDFESGESSVFCTKPGCTHEDTDDTCWGVNDGLLVYFLGGKNFFYLTDAPIKYMEKLKSQFIISDINRQNERVLDTFDGAPVNRTFLHKDVAYLVTIEQTMGELGSENDEPVAINIIAYDCKNEKTLGEFEVINGYDAELSLAYGVYNDKIYYKTGSFSEKVDWSILDEEGGHEKLLSQKRFEYIALDTQTQEIQRSDSLSELLGLEIEIEKPQFIIDDVLHYDTGGVIYAYNLNTNENDMVYDGEYEYTIQAGDRLIYHINWLENNSYIYDPKTKESRRIYRPENGDWAMGTPYGLWYEHGEYIYIDSASNVGAVEGYEQYDPFIIKVHKDDIYKEEYEAEIVS